MSLLSIIFYFFIVKIFIFYSIHPLQWLSRHPLPIYTTSQVTKFFFDNYIMWVKLFKPYSQYLYNFRGRELSGKEKSPLEMIQKVDHHTIALTWVSAYMYLGRCFVKFCTLRWTFKARLDYREMFKTNTRQTIVVVEPIFLNRMYTSNKQNYIRTTNWNDPKKFNFWNKSLIFNMFSQWYRKNIALLFM